MCVCVINPSLPISDHKELAEESIHLLHCKVAHRQCFLDHRRRGWWRRLDDIYLDSKRGARKTGKAKFRINAVVNYLLSNINPVLSFVPKHTDRSMTKPSLSRRNSL